MKTLDDIKLESTLHTRLIEACNQAIRYAELHELDSEDSIEYSDFNGQLEVMAMDMVKLISKGQI